MYTTVTVPASCPPPWQVPVTGLSACEEGGFRYEPVARFIETGVVVAKDSFEGWFYEDELTGACPVDLAMVWGDLSEPDLLEGIEAVPSRERWVSIRIRARQDRIQPIMGRVDTFLGNNHIVILDPVLHRAVKSIGSRDNVTLDGYLVNISKDLWSVRTSTTRDDQFLGACEIILPVSIRVNDRLYRGRDPFASRSATNPSP